MEINDQTYLEHYGVRGMKWGVRKERTGSDVAARRQRRAKRRQVVGKVASGVVTGVQVAAVTAGAAAAFASLSRDHPVRKAMSKGLHEITTGDRSIALQARGLKFARAAMNRG